MRSSSLIIFLLPVAVLASSLDTRHRHHGHAVALRRTAETAAANGNGTEKRATAATAFSGARMTWYGTGTGADACTGKDHRSTDYVVAMDFHLFRSQAGNAACCGRRLKLEYNGKTAYATCVDECASCYKEGQLDLTQGLFKYFAELSEGIIYGSWSYADNHAAVDDGAPTNDTSADQVHTFSATSSSFSAASEPSAVETPVSADTDVPESAVSPSPDPAPAPTQAIANVVDSRALNEAADESAALLGVTVPGVPGLMLMVGAFLAAQL